MGRCGSIPPARSAERQRGRRRCPECHYPWNFTVNLLDGAGSFRFGLSFMSSATIVPRSSASRRIASLPLADRSHRQQWLVSCCRLHCANVVQRLPRKKPESSMGFFTSGCPSGPLPPPRVAGRAARFLVGFGVVLRATLATPWAPAVATAWQDLIAACSWSAARPLRHHHLRSQWRRRAGRPSSAPGSWRLAFPGSRRTFNHC